MITVVRWATLAVLLVLALVDPMPGRAGWPAWAFVLVYIGYALVTDLLRYRWSWYRSRPQLAILDLAVAGGLYLLGWAYAGPLYTLVFLVVVSAAVSLTPRGAFLYMVAAAVVITIAELTIRWSSPLDQVIADIGGRVLRLGLVALGAILLMHRLALEREAARQAHDEAERLGELDRLRGHFVAAVSHDLQTPLTAVRAGLGLLEASAGDRLRGDEADLLTNARRNVDRLGLQINDLLTLNQIEANALQLEPLPFDLRAAITDAIAVVHALVQQKDQTLEVDVATPLMVDGDPRRLEQVITNLLVNAHRHTPAGTRITISGKNSLDEVLLTVADDGPGIPADVRDRIFDRFHRLEPAGEGSGLGLTIVKAIVERHGGRIWIESPGERGVSFCVALPRADDGDRPCR